MNCYDLESGLGEEYKEESADSDIAGSTLGLLHKCQRRYNYVCSMRNRVVSRMPMALRAVKHPSLTERTKIKTPQPQSCEYTDVSAESYYIISAKASSSSVSKESGLD